MNDHTEFNKNLIAKKPKIFLIACSCARTKTNTKTKAFVRSGFNVSFVVLRPGLFVPGFI